MGKDQNLNYLKNHQHHNGEYQQANQDLQTHLLHQKTPEEAETSKGVSFIFGVIFFTNLMVNVDHGIMPAATTELKEDLELNEIQLGILGSLVYLGLVLGSLFAMPLFNYCNTKFIIIVCLFSNCAGLILFTVSTNFYILALSRGAVGFFQVFFCIYFPVWVDHFGDEKKKTTWLTNLMLGVPLGVILGYILTAFLIINANWRWTFYVQAVLIVPLALCFMFTPARYIVYGGHGGGGVDNISRATESLNYFNLSVFSSRAPSHYRANSLVQRRDFESERNIATEETKSPTFGRQINDYTHPEGPMAQQTGYNDIDPNDTVDNSFLNDSRIRQNSLRQVPVTPSENSMLHLNKAQSHAVSRREMNQKPQQSKRERKMSTISKIKRRQDRNNRKLEKMLEHYSLGRKICYLLTQPTFMFLLLALTFIFFISTGTQFWITDYQQSVLNLSKERAYLHFAVAAITGPVLGVLVGGALFTHLGGYNHPKALPIAVCVISLGGFCGLPAIYFDDPIIVMSFLWLQFFCGGFTMPVLTGILLNLVPQSMRTLANAIANLVYNLLGYLPAPFVYGFFYQKTGGGNSRWGLFSIEIVCLLTPIFMSLTLIAKKASSSKATKNAKKQIEKTQVGAADLMDNDQIGALLSHSSDESMLRKRKNMDMSFLSDEDEEDDEEEAVDNQSYRTPASERLMLDSMSVFYSKSVYPTSLAIYRDDD